MSDRKLLTHAYPIAGGGMILIEHPMTKDQADGIFRRAREAATMRCPLQCEPRAFAAILNHEVERLVAEFVDASPRC